MCHIGRSAKQALFLIYEAVTLAELKGYLMLQFSWAYRVNFKRESTLTHERFINRANTTRNILQSVLASSDNVVYKCGPRTFVEEGTYLRVNSFVSGVIVQGWAHNSNQSLYKGPITIPHDNQGLDPCKLRPHNCEPIERPLNVCLLVRNIGLYYYKVI